ncbi:MAG TPA: hypothetical protein VHO72_16490 [Bacteroidales bacterium]|nr:hypothetical protein [Bacteroidales bacterium]
MAEVANPKVILKKKQVPTIVEFCLEEAIEFSVKQQTFPDTDWEIEMKMKDFKAAVLLGMFLRENRIDIDGIDPQRYKKSAKKADEKPEPPAKEEKTKQEKSASNLMTPASDDQPTLI